MAGPATPSTAPADAQPEAERRLRRVPDLINADPIHAQRARLLDADIMIRIGAAGFLLRVERGRLAPLEPASHLMRSWSFAIRADAAAWLDHWQDPPAPGWHDILAMSKRGVLTVEGILVPFMQHLQFIKDVLAAPRHDR